MELTHPCGLSWPALQPLVPLGLLATRTVPPLILDTLPLYSLSSSRNSLSLCVGGVI